jgi:hypothetical protein
VAAAGGPGALAELARNDLVVLATQGEVVGAYPLTTAETPHGLRVHGHALHAMCALDAPAVRPLCDAEAQIRSRCHVTGTPIRAVQGGDDPIAASPSDRVRVEVRWGPVAVTDSGSLWRTMVFRRDEETGGWWERKAPGMRGPPNPPARPAKHRRRSPRSESRLREPSSSRENGGSTIAPAGRAADQCRHVQ